MDKKSSGLKAAFDELVKAVKYRNDSRNGLLSMDTFLDIVGDFCDKEIEKEKASGSKYINGICEVRNLPEEEAFLFTITLSFITVNGDEITKDLSVKKNCSEFVREALDNFIEHDSVEYQIYDKE